jgi:hypothetical protein
MCGTPAYKLWTAIKQRCLNPNYPRFCDYGGRGITICDEWRRSFEAFYEHVGDRPAPHLSLDRIDNNRGYEPGNVRWATRSTQMKNRRPPQRATRAMVTERDERIRELEAQVAELGRGHRANR